MRKGARGLLGVVAVGLIIVLVGTVVTLAWLRERGQVPPLPFEQRCVATTPDKRVVLTLDQARWTAIVVGVGVGRDLGTHAATIAMATVYQEAGIRNLDYGDRDSVGLFQQRPSQGWGTPEQIMDPWYSTTQFYDALVEIPGWESGDVNDTAQAVQRSGHPHAYRKHETKARALAAVFAGDVPAGLSCFDERSLPGDPDTFRTELQRTFGSLSVETDPTGLTVRAQSDKEAAAITAFAVANAGRLGIARVESAGQVWNATDPGLPVWRTGGGTPDDVVGIVFR